jgi:DNA modification methylase
MVPVDTLVPYAKNARTHSSLQVETIAGLMLRFGFTNPVLRDEANMIIAGHGRVMAAKLNVSRGHALFERVPVITARGWSEDDRRAYVLADNQSALMAGWDEALLGSELTALVGAGFDTASLGFGGEEVRRYMGHGGLTDPDVAPTRPEKPVSRLGDMWRLGRHRALCGDSCASEAVSRLLAGEKPHLMVTDPPYGVSYDPKWRINRGLGGKGSATGVVTNDGRADWREAYDLFPGAVAYAWSAGLRSKEAIEGLLASGFEMRAQIIWVKSTFAIGRGNYHFQHEPCWYAVRKGQSANWAGDRKQTTVWMIDKPQKSETGHGTQKPVECMRRPIENNSNEGDQVYDPFLGSGTTIIAAEMENRTCFGLEIDPGYCDVIVKRWQAFTGQKATLGGDGGRAIGSRHIDRTFDEIAAERAQTPNERDA